MDESNLPEDWLEAANLHATVAQLLSTVIHQVNNALQTVGGHAELLKSDPGVTETTKRRAATITGVTDRTAAMLASFQVFTRPPLEPAVQNLREVAARALAFRHYGLGRARIQATVDGVDSAPVLAEPRPLTQAVLNVILNAEQAMTGRDVEGHLDLRVGRDPGRVWLTVDDNGPGPVGVPPSGGSGTGVHGLGPNNRLGLGLWAARRIVQRLGGALEAEALPGGGTRVRITLPEAPALEDAPG